MATPQEIRDYFAKVGSKGGKKTAQNLSKKQRQESARRAAQARWAKQKKEKP